MPRVSCGRAGSTPRDRYKYLTQGSAGSCRIWGQVVQAICPLFFAPVGRPTPGPKMYIYDRTPNRATANVCVWGRNAAPAPEFCKKGVPFVARLANMGDTGLLVSGSFRKGPCRALLRGYGVTKISHKKSQNLCQKQHAERKFVWYVKKRIS